ncbi:MAG: radical SAM family heme chaperone HemW [Chloroflexi bacterium]|nr:radical SAM family heme chaperone HemW [Chloroflexota bacterium]
MTTQDTRRISLYVHVPFCETKCPYCDFNTYARIEWLMPSYIKAVVREIRLWGRLLARPTVHTVFLGGGTPSYLPSEDIEKIMAAVRVDFVLEGNAEITMEANPGDFDARKLESYLAAGVNRLSIGVQSFDDGLLQKLGRRHSAKGAGDAYRMAIDAGFDNVSIDLMYGLPYQDAGQWESTLDKMSDLNPAHVSMYCLTLEGGTPMEQWVKSGRMPEPDPDLAADMYLAAQERMKEQGYRHYEISNWAKTGMESRHNLTYWRNEPYLGVGPGAHSYMLGLKGLPGYRFFNLKSPRDYIERLNAPLDELLGPSDVDMKETIENVAVVDGVEDIDKDLEMAETMMMGLRLDVGIEVETFRKRFGGPPSDYYGETLDDLVTLGLLTTDDGSLRLTHRGRMMGNQVFSRFF